MKANNMTSWQDKRINEINKLCRGSRSCHANFADEVYDIYQSKANSYEQFVKEQSAKKAKHETKLIKYGKE